MTLTHLCAECETPNPTVTFLPTGEKVCGRRCYNEVQFKYVRMVQRFRAEQIHEYG